MPEIIAPVEAGGGGGDVAEDYARSAEEGIASHKEPWNPPN
jgi:hypothetical protein